MRQRKVSQRQSQRVQGRGGQMHKTREYSTRQRKRGESILLQNIDLR